jgi:site-specific recombinase XerD
VIASLFEQEYIDYLDIELGLSDTTMDLYQKCIKQFLRFIGDRYPGNGLNVVDIEEKDVRSYLVYLKNERGNVPKSRNSQLTGLRSYFRFLVLYDYVEEGKNPTRRLRNVKITRKLPVFLHEEEANALLEHAKKNNVYSERDYAMLRLLLQTGCRAKSWWNWN